MHWKECISVNIKAPSLKPEYIIHSTVHWMYSNWTPLANTITYGVAAIWPPRLYACMWCASIQPPGPGHFRETSQANAAAEDIAFLCGWTEHNGLKRLWEFDFMLTKCCVPKKPCCCISIYGEFIFRLTRGTTASIAQFWCFLVQHLSICQKKKDKKKTLTWNTKTTSCVEVQFYTLMNTYLMHLYRGAANTWP